MKKLVFTMIAVLLGMALNAQVSVWDGTAEPWTMGNGTAENPYLIENAQQLAYLAYATNEIHHGNYDYNIMYADTCFLLTTDLDLGGDNGLVWEPIAHNGFMTTRCFGGHFDGGNHTITNMSLMDGANRLSIGLFGHVKEGVVENIIIDGNSIVVPEYHNYGESGGLGMIIGFGESVTVRNCVNKVDVTWEYLYGEYGCAVGGLFGWMLNSTITNCHNLGDVIVSEANVNHGGICAGGVCGALLDCDISECSSRNYANIAMQNGDHNYGEVICGGIAGRMSGTMTNCFNIGDFNVTADFLENEHAGLVGGLVGCTYQESMTSLNNCYSVSNISVAGNNVLAYIGGIVGNTDETAQVDVNNCYYRNTVESGNDFGTPKTDEEMKTQGFVDLLNAGGGCFIMDPTGYFNFGYPMLEWYYDSFNSVNENKSIDAVSVYPNPAKDNIYIELSPDADCQSVELYTLDGRLVKTCHGASQQTTIHVENLNAGVYILKLRMADGKEFAERIVKE